MTAEPSTRRETPQPGTQGPLFQKLLESATVSGALQPTVCNRLVLQAIRSGSRHRSGDTPSHPALGGLALGFFAIPLVMRSPRKASRRPSPRRGNAQPPRGFRAAGHGAARTRRGWSRGQCPLGLTCPPTMTLFPLLFVLIMASRPLTLSSLGLATEGWPRGASSWPWARARDVVLCRQSLAPGAMPSGVGREEAGLPDVGGRLPGRIGRSGEVQDQDTRRRQARCRRSAGGRRQSQQPGCGWRDAFGGGTVAVMLFWGPAC